MAGLLGSNLHEWTVERLAAGGIGVDEAATLFGRLVGLMRTVHDARLVIRDLKPANVMVTPSGELRLIDVETVAEWGQRRRSLATPGFAAPELDRDRPLWDLVPEPPSDCYSLGITIFTVLTGLSPTWISGRANSHRRPAEVKDLLTEIAGWHPSLVPFIDLIVGLTDRDPTERWTVERTLAYVTETGPGSVDRAAKAAAASRMRPNLLGEIDKLVTGSLTSIQRAMTPQETSLWKPGMRWQRHVDPCTAWIGAAGVLATLTRAAQAIDDPSLLDTIGTATKWIDERLFDVPRLLPGLSFGRSGTAWALYDAARLLGDEPRAARALELATRLPTEWHSPDVTHGMSGAGLAHLYLWQASGDDNLRDRALTYADNVAAAAQRRGSDWLWPIGTDTDSDLAGASVYGFAHGIAGVGAFLLATAQTLTGDHPADTARKQRYLEAAVGAGDTLARAAIIKDGTATWPGSTDGGRPYNGRWCGGHAGIGSFLIRLWDETRRTPYADLAEQAARAATANPWTTLLGACCGVSGDGHLLLDMAELTSQDEYRAHAEGIANVIYHRRTSHDGLERVCEPGEGHTYNYGSAGVLGFLLRVRFGGPLMWMPPTPPKTAKRRPARRPKREEVKHHEFAQGAGNAARHAAAGCRQESS